MSKYSIHTLLSDQLIAKLKRHHPKLVKGKTDDELFAVCIKSIGSRDPKAFFNSMESSTLAEELLFRRDRQIIFPQSEEILTTLYNSKYNLRNSDFLPDYVNFVLAIPKGFKIEGVEIPSAMFSIRTSEKFAHDAINKVGKMTENDKAIEYLSRSYAAACLLDMNVLEPIASVCYFLKDTSSIRMTIPISKMPDAVRCKTAKEFSDLLGVYNNSGKPSLLPILKPEEIESEQQRILFRLFASILVYTTAAPDALKDGLPGKFARTLTTPDYVKPIHSRTLSLLGKHTIKTSPKAHYRTFHFRQLTHDRYYQNDHKDLKRGSRVVFVKESMVGGAEPKTLTDEGLTSDAVKELSA